VKKFQCLDVILFENQSKLFVYYDIEKKVYLLWGGTDCHTLHNYKYLPKNNKNLIYLSISDNISETLKRNGIPFIKVPHFNLLEKEYFKTNQNIPKKNIYIYNGLNGNKNREDFFSKSVYKKVEEELIKYHSFQKKQFIYSNELYIPYEKINQIYQSCFIGLRLCPQDGNANTVQEFQYLKIPIIHNCSKYGMKWKNEKDIIKTILKIYSSQNRL